MQVDNPNPPSVKPNLTQWLEGYLPFSLPDIPFARTAANLDRALARLVAAGGENLTARVDASTKRIQEQGLAATKFIRAGAAAASHGVKTDTALADRAIDFAIGDAIRAQQNRESIARLAIENLHREPPAKDAGGEIGNDWLNVFARLSSEKGEADVQALWGRILAGEIRQPGSFKLRTLSTLAAIDGDDATKICTLLKYTINWKFIFVADQLGEPSYDLLATGEETGILVSTAFPSEQTWSLPKDKVGGFDAQDTWLRVTADRALSATYYTYALTQPGRDLLKIVGRQQMPSDYVQEFGMVLKRAGFQVTIAMRGRELEDGKFELLQPRVL